VFFEKTLKLPDDMQEKLRSGETIKLDLTSKALNTSWNVQPENPEPNRNPHGCCVNHWYHVPVQVSPKINVDQPAPEGEFANKPSGGRFARPFCNLNNPRDAPHRKTTIITASSSDS
jgi:hypothetical protein